MDDRRKKDHKPVVIMPRPEAPGSNQQKINVNPNPRANENIRSAPAEKSTEGSIGSEITDGEDA